MSSPIGGFLSKMVESRVDYHPGSGDQAFEIKLYGSMHQITVALSMDAARELAHQMRVYGFVD